MAQTIFQLRGKIKYFRSKNKRKMTFPLYFSKLFVTLASISAYHDVFGYQSSMNYVAIALVSIYSLLCNKKPRIVNVMRKPAKCPVCGERVVDIIYGTGDMTEIEYLLE